MTNLADLLQGFQRSAWRLEARDSYDISDEREQFDEFVRTGHATPSQEDREFQQFIRDLRANGREIGRVRIVGSPVTLYTRFEFDYYPSLTAAGEDIRVVDRGELEDAEGPWETDFWIFDDRIVAIMNYTASGAFEGVSVVDDPAAIQPFLAARRQLLARSRALADYNLAAEGQRRRVA